MISVDLMIAGQDPRREFSLEAEEAVITGCPASNVILISAAGNQADRRI
jgi:hypothetical protein